MSASPFAEWFDHLDRQAAAKVTIGIARLSLGNVSNIMGVGAGVQEYRINWGPGYGFISDATGKRS